MVLCNRYFKVVLLHVRVLISNPRLYNMESVDLEFSSTMYSNLMVADWSSEHLDNCMWYLDCPKNKTPQSE
jgi:hypothetical protein